MMLVGVLVLEAFALTMSARIMVKDTLSVKTAKCMGYMIGSRSYCKPPTISLFDNIGGFDENGLSCIKTYCEEEQAKEKPSQPCCATFDALKGDEFGVGSRFYRSQSEEVKTKLKNALGIFVEDGVEVKPLADGPKPWERDAQNRGNQAGPTVTETVEDNGEGCWCATVHNGYGFFPKSRRNMIGPNGRCTSDDPCNTCSWRETSGGHNALYDCCIPLEDGSKGSECGGVVMPDFKASDTCRCKGLSKLKSQLWQDNSACHPETPCFKCHRDCA